MALETFNFIDSLNASNPVHATDQVSEGDDHIRGIKTTLLNSFPNIDAAVNFTPTEANRLVGLTGLTGTGNLVASASPTFTGDVTVNQIGGIDQANLVDKSASETISGATWAFQAVTAVTYDGIAAANLVDKSASETISGATWAFQAITVTSLNGIAATNLLDETAAIDDTVTNSSARQPGYKGVPVKTQNGNYTLILGDAGKIIRKASGGAGETITIPANASVAFPIGTVIEIINDGGGNLSIAITTDTLEEYVTGNTGTRTLADNGKAIIEKVTSTLWKISGLGIS